MRVIDLNSDTIGDSNYVTLILAVSGNEDGAAVHALVAAITIGSGNACQTIELDVAQGVVFSVVATSVQVDVTNKATGGEALTVTTTAGFGTKPTSAAGLLSLEVGRIDINATSLFIRRPSCSSHVSLLCVPNVYPLLQLQQHFTNAASANAVDNPSSSMFEMPLLGRCRFLAIKNNSGQLVVCHLIFRIGI